MPVDLVDRPLPLDLAEGLAADVDDFPVFEVQRLFSREKSDDNMSEDKDKR